MKFTKLILITTLALGSISLHANAQTPEGADYCLNNGDGTSASYLKTECESDDTDGVPACHDIFVKSYSGPDCQDAATDDSRDDSEPKGPLAK